MKKGRRWLYAVLAVGLIGLGAGGGTFATFNAQTTNGGNTFATGNLLLSNQVNSGTVCFSYNDANNNNQNTTPGCAAVVDVSGGEPGALAIGTITVGNVGSLNASQLTLAESSCTSGNNGNVTSFHGSGTLCNDLALFVDETGQGSVNSSGVYTGSTSDTYCWYGTCPNVSTLTGTALTLGQTVSSLDVTPALTANASTVLDVTDPATGHSEELTSTAGTQTNTTTVSLAANQSATYAFPTGSDVFNVADAPSASIGSLGTLTLADKTGSNTPLTAGEGRVFEVGIYLPESTGNSDQGLSASFSLTWTINQ